MRWLEVGLKVAQESTVAVVVRAVVWAWQGLVVVQVVVQALLAFHLGALLDLLLLPSPPWLRRQYAPLAL